jgi:hypothetical protein
MHACRNGKRRYEKEELVNGPAMSAYDSLDPINNKKMVTTVNMILVNAKC